MQDNEFLVIRDETYFKKSYNRDKRLSLKAKGLLGMVLDLPASWQFTIKGLLTIVKEEETALRNTIRELNKNGYCYYERTRNETGQLKGTRYVFFQACQTTYPNGKKPNVDYPHEGKPNVDNQPQYNKEVLKDGLKKGEGDKTVDSKKGKRPLPESVKIWLEKMQIEINETGVKLIESRVKNLLAWEHTLEGWLASNWTKNNIAGQIDRYDKTVKDGNYPKPEKMKGTEKNPETVREEEDFQKLIYGKNKR